MPTWLQNWLTRHQHPASQVLHAIGIPLLVWGCVLAVIQLIDNRWDLWYRPVALIIASYFLQWIGHRIEGNDMGELILIKKILGKPYIAVAPRYTDADDRKNSTSGASGTGAPPLPEVGD